MFRYRSEFTAGKKLTTDEVTLLLAWYAEDVMRVVEREVREAEEQVRHKYPEAMYIELEPDSKKMGSYAIDEGRKNASFPKMEIDTIKQMQSNIEQQKMEDMARMGSSAWDVFVVEGREDDDVAEQIIK